MTFASLLAFAGLCLLLALTPGPDTFLVLRTSLRRVGAGLATAAGCSVAGIVWALLVGVGLAALLEQSAELFRWLKIAGGVYLLYLGVSAFLRGRRERARMAAKTAEAAAKSVPLPGQLSGQQDGQAAGRAAGSPELQAAGRSQGRGRQSSWKGNLAGFGAGALSTLLNPKVGLFYLALVPQFIPHGGNTLLTALVLGGVEALIGGAYLSLVAFAAAKAMGLLRKPRVELWLDRASNTIIGGLGLGILVSSAAN
ncbi:LysE family translocator [Paeniglutamicibacter antarcticus]|uniref:LysE family translocator n=1 Tax=Arthrobacter terrae TaxID=2935737 RepID=A0A931G6K8_9MICC|nr:LysE family translocator [Arthrobacter terrae]MBG0738419.1 LysE family translocator [Arthrobacter terrae]